MTAPDAIPLLETILDPQVKKRYTIGMERNIVIKPEEQLCDIYFADKRLTERLRESVSKLSGSSGGSVLGALGSRHEAKAFYRLLSNEKFELSKLEQKVKQSVVTGLRGRILLVQDTSDINLNTHEKTEGLGYCSEHIKGVKIHTTLALTDDGLPLGIVTQHYETRATSKQELGSKRAEQLRAIEEKESYRWVKAFLESTEFMPKEAEAVTVCDREGDFYEFLSVMTANNGKFVVRASQNRVTETSEKAFSRIKATKACAGFTIEVPRKQGEKSRIANMELAFCKVEIQKPLIRKDSALPDSLPINIVRATEIGTNEKPIEWIILTNLDVGGCADALMIIEYYTHRWKIERFFNTLKGGCKVEQIQQRSVEKVKALLLIYSVIAAYILTLTYLSRLSPELPCTCILSDEEWRQLYRLANRTKNEPTGIYTIQTAMNYLSQLGGYKRAPSDGPPGNKAVWKGLTIFYKLLDVLMGQV
jgi:hypothetical protein